MLMPERISGRRDGEEKSDIYLSPSVQRSVRLLRHVLNGDPVTSISRTARELGINRTTLLRLLRTLQAERFIERRSDGNGWRIGVGLIGLAAQAFYCEDIVQISVPALSDLADALNLSAHLGVLDGLEIVYLLRRAPNSPFASNIRVGSRLPAHAANMGRIILAHLSPERIDRIYAGVVLNAVTPRTAVTLAQLHAQLEGDRAAGLAWSDGNYEPGISSVAAAIFDATGAPVAAINVNGRSADFAGDARRAHIADAVAATASEISQRLGWRKRGTFEPAANTHTSPASGARMPDARAAE
jgi:DNA-binding IclR family transcriptional regulator